MDTSTQMHIPVGKLRFGLVSCAASGLPPFRIAIWICVLSTLQWCNESSSRADEEQCLNRAVEWLVNQQDESGAFKSTRYGAMKQGAALTSLALYAMSMTPEECRSRHQASIDKAFSFLLPGTGARGRVANPDGSLDHDVYSTAMFLTAAKRLDHELDTELVEKLLNYLVESQCTESRGFEKDNPNFGGWDVIGPDVMPGKTSGTNVSITRFVLEAFAHWVPIEPKPDNSVNEEVSTLVNRSRRHSVMWLKRLHASGNGTGFHFSAHPGSALNKSQDEEGKPLPYSTATCDALLALKLAGAKVSNEYMQGFRWLASRVRATNVFGFPDEDQSGWPQALHFYHLQCLRRASSGAGAGEFRQRVRSEMSKVILAAQKEDGRFENESALMRENDPLIATSFAIIALSAD